ncbi:CDP-alcohol phosphatidyltransferase-domain-containing protein [Dimargaris cristalligena]|uniref:CDP-diacylglycerol--inositol 3-phosphatidyltransferase n=1 Tax=Dimargaris cristalligena TaxID=215637 RepID=A0A4P9ZXD4_9FUNG|nr:CDP-alcohol phosphatidyltransferase-domain-containing protein [Dimargaris cristalligena]|eukprot:RKP38313.1 CDP-alcohol phosphatidyltransferase-domain-containing protein [Dimargaris cristalligena]
MAPSSENVFLFIPNLIGYLRVVLAGLALYFMAEAPWSCLLCYGVSCLLDALDGQAARYFKQSSRFGAVLDMVTDRCTTICLLCFLAQAYPAWTVLFQLLISLDISSHYIHMYSSLVAGAESHKQISDKQNVILRAYYHNNNVLFLFCFANEAFFMTLYMLHFVTEYTGVIYALMAITFPICAGKQIISIIQLAGSSQQLAAIDIRERQKARSLD